MNPKYFLRPLFVFLLILVTNCIVANTPNVIIILADDMGSGDVHSYNPDSKIPTPNLDRLVSEGMAFTDAHSGAAVCTPTRYGLITGRYSWRSSKKRGVLNGYSPHLIDPDRFTIADVFKQKGYTTACIGKWHLGMDLVMTGDQQVDFSGKIENSPNVNGFDYFFGITASLDFPPYLYIRNNKFTETSTLTYPKSDFPAYLREGPVGEKFKHISALDRLTQESVMFIEKQAKKNKPFFLYFPLTAPHKPVMPAPRFQGKSEYGPYGDFIVQTDWTVGQVLKAVDAAGITKNTVVIFSSDNASFMYRMDGEGHMDDPSIQGYKPEVHQSNYVYRGTKADVWEGGHRVPFIARWPGVIDAGSKNSKTICLTDLLATCGDILKVPVPKNAGEDSFSLVPLFHGNKSFQREPVIVQSGGGMFAIRNGPWKLVLGNGSGGREQPKGKYFQGPYQLYNLGRDISEKKDVASQNPEIVSSMIRMFDEIYLRTEQPVQHPAD